MRYSVHNVFIRLHKADDSVHLSRDPPRVRLRYPAPSGFIPAEGIWFPPAYQQDHFCNVTMLITLPSFQVCAVHWSDCPPLEILGTSFRVPQLPQNRIIPPAALRACREWGIHPYMRETARPTWSLTLGKMHLCRDALITRIRIYLGW